MKKLKNIQFSVNIFFIVICALIIYPLLMVIAVSLSSEADIANYGYLLIPKKIDLSAYKFVFDNPTRIINAYKITGIASLMYMVLSVLFMSMAAYPLSNRTFKARKYVNFYFYFTMLFGGGLVPSYILITRYLNLDDTIWVYVLPGLISPWYIFMMRTFFADVPSEMLEAVKIDGGNQYTAFFRFVLPLSKPVLATVALFMFLGKWNDWNTSMLYINDSKLYSLQFLLQDIMENINMIQSSTADKQALMDIKEIPTETVRMAMAMVVAGPALVVFPFFQKYFVKGLTVGSVKG